MKTNDILLIAGIGVGLYFLSRQSARPASTATSAIDRILSPILKPQQQTYAPGVTAPAATAPGATVADYINASSNVINAISKAFGGGSGVTGADGATFVPKTGNAGTYYAVQSDTAKKPKSPATLKPSPEAYFKQYSFYN